MPLISKIEQQKKNKNRFNIYITEEGQPERYAFSVDDDLLVRMRLSKGMEVDELSIMEIQYRDHIQKAFQSAVNYLSYRIRSEHEVISYLSEKEWEQAVIDEVIHKLREYRYVDDEEYANAFVRTQMNVSKKGPDVIRTELLNKGISEKDQQTALSQYTNDLQRENAEEWASKTLKKSKGSMKEAKQKTIQFLVRKGFSMSLAKLVTEELAVDDKNAEWESLVKTATKFHRKYAQLDDYSYSQKMKTALFRKGFDMDLISRFVELGKERIDNGDFELY
ncbi:recombination regulator RecX [Pradoshia sp. D12]|uniref:recombination regulator RecX n=1 Tax=Bacillaceae TaxID=186817 RepID=UPI001124C089|nr:MULTISPECIES: recombination regulator RecX [Bacillaceae]QFK70300.1 recombination regulator RecX [Pradoshia sp. D12]TPF71081.1 recombination regulator RecX [Bacillus sp. D12]